MGSSSLHLIFWSALCSILLHRVSSAFLQHGAGARGAAGLYKLRLDNYENVQYTAPLTVGGQELPVIYDTGSFEVLVLSTLCTRCIGYSAPLYDNRRSPSFQGSGGTAEHYFGSGPVLSRKGFDTVRLGPGSSPYTSFSMPFWQIVDHDLDIWRFDARFSGIVGLSHLVTVPEGYGDEASSDDRTLMETMHVARFSFCFQRDSASRAPGWLAVSPIVTPSLFQSVDVVGEVHWAARMTGFSAPGIYSSDVCNPSCAAIVDSGTSLLAAPPQARGFMDKLRGLIEPDCSNVHALPVLRFDLGGIIVDLPPQAYVMRASSVAGNSSILDRLFGGPSLQGETCQLAVMEIDKQSQFGPVFILGMPFMRYYYTVFDRYNKKMHMSRASSTCDPVGPPSGIGFANVSNNVTNTSQGTTSHVFSGNDYQPLMLDPRAARAPEWAFRKDSGTSLRV